MTDNGNFQQENRCSAHERLMTNVEIISTNLTDLRLKVSEIHAMICQNGLMKRVGSLENQTASQGKKIARIFAWGSACVTIIGLVIALLKLGII